MDGWVDGWMDKVGLIICLAIWTLYKPRGPLVFDEVRAILIASRNRLRSLSLLERILNVFGAIFGGFGRPKWMPNLVFKRFFGDAFFDHVLALILHGFLEA